MGNDVRKSHLFPSFIILVSVVVCLTRNSAVTESRSSYSCCDTPTIKFDGNCEATFNIKGKSIAHSKSNGCVSPCVKIEGGRMTLDECVDVNTTLVSTDEMNVTSEKKILYSAQTCPTDFRSKNMAPGNQASAGLRLLAVMIHGLIVKVIIC